MAKQGVACKFGGFFFLKNAVVNFFVEHIFETSQLISYNNMQIYTLLSHLFRENKKLKYIYIQSYYLNETIKKKPSLQFIYWAPLRL